MKRFIIFLVLFFFLIVGTVKSTNLIFDSPIDLSYTLKDSANNISSIRGFYENDSFYVGVYEKNIESTNRGFSLAKYEETAFSTLLDGWDFSGTWKSWDFKPYNTSHAIMIHDWGQESRNISYVALSDLRIISLFYDTTMWMNGNIQNASAGITPYGAVLRPQSRNTPVKYVNDSWNGYATLSMPNAYDEPHDLDLFYYDGRFHLILEEQAIGQTSIYDLLYDESWNYIKTNAVADTETGNMTNPSWSMKAGTFYLTYLTESYIFREEKNATIRFRAFTWDSDLEKFYNIFSEEHTPSNIVAGINYTTSAYLYYDDTHGHFWLFYSVYNTSNEAFLGLYVQSELGFCDCTSWENKSCISGTAYRERIRVCPFDCDDEIGSVWDSWCNQTLYYPDHSFPRTSTVSGTGTCDTGWYDPVEYGQIRCDASILIPENCTNINTSATFSLNVENSKTFWANLGDTKYSVTICNPLTHCYQYTDSWLCDDQSNLTLTIVNSSYNAGETATGSMVVVGSNCAHRKNVLWEYGWKRYMVQGSITYFCDQYCGGWKCRTLGLVEQKVWQYPDCTFNESSAIDCDYGCLDGECLTSAEAKEGEGDLDQLGVAIGQPVGQLMGVALSSMDNMFPSSDLKILGATIITISVGVGITLMLRKLRLGIVIGLISMLPVFFFFMIRGYFPLWLVLLVAIPSVAFIVAFMIGQKR